MTSPIKGTYPRGSDALEEQALRRALVEDEKETAEHRMLVDLMRNDLGAISRPSSSMFSLRRRGLRYRSASGVACGRDADRRPAHGLCFSVPGWFHHRLSQNGGLRRHRRH